MEADLYWAREIRPDSGPGFVGLPERERVIDEVVQALLGSPGSAAIVGAAGVGKRVVAREVGRRMAASGWSVFEASAGEAIAGLKYVGEVEERLATIMRDDGKVLWLLPDIVAAIGAGTYAENPHGLLDRLLPLLEHRRLRLLAPCEPAEWALAVQARPALAALVAPIRLEPAAQADALRLAEAVLDELGAGAPPELLREALELAREHLTSVAAPGNLLRLLVTAVRRAARDPSASGVLVRDDLIPALAELTGLPEDILDERRALALEDVEAYFTRNVLGQPQAVRVLVERIALIKAGLTDPTRPLGVFLFTGPTGTGKTELAKTLARYLFGSADRLIRVDMSEMQTPDDLERLIGGASVGGGDAVTAAIRREPFSVVLLDEMEKAHPRVFDLFLQVFDDGRLTDRTGATADFRHAVVIMTANIVPARRHERAAAIGFVPAEPEEPPEPDLADALAGYFRPEFINRIDRVVAFSPLSRDVMRGLIAKELGEVTRRRGLRTRPWAVEWDDSAIEMLLREGFTPTLGARPLKRAVEEHVLAPLARAIVEHRVPEGDQFLLVGSPDGRRIDVRFVDPDLDVPVGEARAAGELDVRAIALDPHGSDDEVIVLRDELERLTALVEAPEWRERKDAALAAASAEGFWDSPDRFRVLADAEQRDRSEAALATARSLLGRLVRARAGRGRPGRLAHLLAQRLFLLDVALDALAAEEPPDAYMLLQPLDGGRDGFLDELAGMYRAWARRRGMRLRELGAGPGRSGVLLDVGGLGALRLLAPESGLHVFERRAAHRSFDRVAVRVTVAPQPIAPAPADLAGSRRRALAALREVPASAAVARRYRREPSALVRDGCRGGWRTGRIDRVLGGDFDLMTDEG
jgi:ATP-dependent Clp protease ATP-binding subunit ClpC